MSVSKSLKRVFISIIILVVAGFTSGYYFYQNDAKFKYWWDLPLANRLLSASLEIERPFQFFLSGVPDITETSKEVLLNSVRLGAQWIVNMQEESGRFNYWQNPVNNTFSSKVEDNFLRQAGTNYALISAFETTRDSVFYHASIKNLQYLNKFKVRLSEDTAYYMFRNKAKLGGTALPMLVMLKLRGIEQTDQYDQDLKSLANMILLLQKKYGTGQFKSTYVYNKSFTYELDRGGWESNIYPGEALLALTEMYRSFRDDKYLESIEWAVDYYSIDGRWKHFSFMPWTAMAMSRIGIMTEQEKYIDFAFKMTDRILYWQNLNESREEYGSLFGVPTVFSSTWMEGAGEAYALAKYLKQKQRENRYASQMILAANWLTKLQYQEEEVIELGYPESAIGGFKRSFIEPEVRIDNTQHAISAIMKVLQHID